MDITIIFSIFIFFVVGAAIGSFLNATAYRIKNKKSIINDRSECPNCKKKLSLLELIPIFSYIFLGGKCKNCNNKISPHYMIFEILFGLYLSGIGFHLISGELNEIQFILYLLIGMSLMILSISDFLYLEIPDEVHPINIVLGILIALALGSNIFIAIGSGFTAGLIFWLVFRLTGGNKMGFGDVKLAFGLGTIFNLLIFILIVMFSSFFGIFYGILQSKFTNVKIDKVKVPFGAVLSITSLIFIIFSYTNIGKSFLSLYDFLGYFV